MFNTYGVTDEYNAPTEAISEEAGGESEYSEKERKPYEASNNSGKEPGFSFPDMGFFAFIFMYLVQFFPLESPKILLPLAWYSQTRFYHLYQRSLITAAETDRYSSKHSDSEKFIAVLETVNKTW